jgi:thiamine biosynthesis lipoprotein
MVATCLASLCAAERLHADDVNLVRFEYTAVIMAVEARISLYCGEEQAARAAATAAFARMVDLDHVMSDYLSDSELMRLCRAEPGTAVPVSSDLYRVLERSLEISRASGGAFDVTAGPLTHAWREARRSGAVPHESLIAICRDRVGWQLLQLDPVEKTVQLRRDHMQLDLGGIGKGFAVDEAMKVLRERGVDRCLIRLAGDVATGSPPPGEHGWTIAIDSGVGGDVPQRLTLCNQAISTSGDAEQSIEIDGRRHSHIIDPRTGTPLTTRRAVTVIAADASTSDALATAICVLGDDAGMALIERYPGASFILTELAGEGSRTVRSAAFPIRDAAGADASPAAHEGR